MRTSRSFGAEGGPQTKSGYHYLSGDNRRRVVEKRRTTQEHRRNEHRRVHGTASAVEARQGGPLRLVHQVPRVLVVSLGTVAPRQDGEQARRALSLENPCRSMNKLKRRPLHVRTKKTFWYIVRTNRYKRTFIPSC